MPYTPLKGDVLTKFQGLMDKSIGDDSIYIKTIDVIEAIGTDSQLSESERVRMCK